MEAGGQTVKLDIYEGMPHMFQAVPGLPESGLAFAKVDAFLKNAPWKIEMEVAKWKNGYW